MQIIETEYLKPCPFCGGKPVLTAMDNNSQNGTVTTEIRCESCHSAGKTIVAFNQSVMVGEESHNKIIKEVIEAWNCRAETTENTKQLMNICDTLLNLSCLLERGWGATQNLTSDYFGYSKKKHDESNGIWLLHNYDNARIFADIANDYVYQALQMADKLMNDINLKKG